MVVDNAVQHTRPVVFRECNVSVWISAPSYVPETLQFPLQLPCDIEDAVDAVERHVQALIGCHTATGQYRCALSPSPLAPP